VAQPLGERRHHRNGRIEKILQTALALLEVIRPAHGADAGYVVRLRDEPEPAMIEPVDGDVAGVLARQALRVPVMPVDRRTRVLAMRLLELQFVAQEGIASRS